LDSCLTSKSASLPYSAMMCVCCRKQGGFLATRGSKQTTMHEPIIPDSVCLGGAKAAAGRD
jgi:hypothetical protein